MRLLKNEREVIKKVVSSLDKAAKVYLFGSRLDDDKKGGDIDLLVISGILQWRDKRKIRLKLYEEIGQQKIDIILTKNPRNDPFAAVVMKEAIPL